MNIICNEVYSASLIIIRPYQANFLFWVAGSLFNIMICAYAPWALIKRSNRLSVGMASCTIYYAHIAIYSFVCTKRWPNLTSLSHERMSKLLLLNLESSASVVSPSEVKGGPVQLSRQKRSSSPAPQDRRNPWRLGSLDCKILAEITGEKIRGVCIWSLIHLYMFKTWKWASHQSVGLPHDCSVLTSTHRFQGTP